ncbi:MAG: histidine kinase dimerization/phosphoacceptor domain -containing protein [Paracoccaceae bacterium]
MKLPSTSSLGFRLGSTLVLALLPLGVLSVVQTQVTRAQFHQSTLEGIGGASLAAAQPQIDLIRASQTTAKVLAQGLSIGIPEDAECIARMQAVAAAMPEASLIAYIPMSGRMTCASTGEPYDFSGNAAFEAMLARPDPHLVFNPRGPVSGGAVIGAMHPVLDPAGRQVGVVSVSIPNRAVAPGPYGDDYVQWAPRAIVALAGDGTELARSDDAVDPAALLPPGMGLAGAARLAGRPTFARGADGVERIVSVVRVAEDLFLLAIWEQGEGGSWAASALAPYLLPALTWAAALIAAALASGRLVVRHVRALSRAMMAYSEGRQRVTIPDIAEAPTEIQKLHAVYEKLIRDLEQDEAELQNLLVDRERLLREVHHRSGNSLQIIASVMRMYRREASDPALRAVLDGLIYRVIALSSTHTSLYGLDSRRDVAMDAVLGGVVRRLKEIHGIAVGTARYRLDPVRLPPETAVPLALAVAETVGCHFAAQSGMDRGIEVSLSEEGQEIRLSIEGPAVPEFLAETTRGMAALPKRMLMHFAGQLRGRVTTRTEGDRSIVDLVFPRDTA